jgi:hypothetical protein
MAEIKGVLVNGWLRLLRDRYGQEALDAGLATLGVGDQSTLSIPFLPASWYPYETMAALGRFTRAVALNPDRSLSVDIGRAIAEYACTTVYKSLIFSDPLKQLDRLPWVGDMLFRDVRDCQTERTGPASGLVTYRYLNGLTPWPGMCSSLTGFLSRLLELAGASNVSAGHLQCVLKGADTCIYSLTWDA